MCSQFVDQVEAEGLLEPKCAVGVSEKFFRVVARDPNSLALGRRRLEAAFLPIFSPHVTICYFHVMIPSTPFCIKMCPNFCMYFSSGLGFSLDSFWPSSSCMIVRKFEFQLWNKWFVRCAKSLRSRLGKFHNGIARTKYLDPKFDNHTIPYNRFSVFLNHT